LILSQDQVIYDNNVTSAVDHLFRTEYGKIVSFLTKKYGGVYLDVVEDSVQEALYSAMKIWPFGGIPQNPSGWIFKVANNKSIDKLRRLSKTETSIDASQIENKHHEELDHNDMYNILKDDLLKMLFACCHPDLAVEHQIILSLKILCGFSVREIAACLLKKETAIAKSFTRAKQSFVKNEILVEVPTEVGIKTRLNTVLKVIYLLFNEGYKSSEGENLYDEDVCFDALRLNHLLLENSITNTSEANALAALMYFHMARFESRISAEGELITLENQDRSLWDKALVKEGFYYLSISVKELRYSEYHIQAVIASVHCRAVSYDETNWVEILTLYDALLKVRPSPVTRLNRLVVLSKVKGAVMALKQLREIEESGFFDNYYLFHAIKGQILFEVGKLNLAKISYKTALELTKNSKEVDFMQLRIKSMG